MLSQGNGSKKPESQRSAGFMLIARMNTMSITNFGNQTGKVSSMQLRNGAELKQYNA